MSQTPSFFTRGADDGVFLPTEFALGKWAPDSLNGPAVCALAAHRLETEFGSPDFTPARLTIDLFKSAKQVPTTTSTRLVRSGRRIVVAEVEVIQGDATVARAGVVFLRKSAPPPGSEWDGAPTLAPPPSEVSDHRLRHPWIQTDDTEWTQNIGDHQNTSRKRVWGTGVSVLPDEPPSPLVRATQSAETTSLVTNLGTEGIGYINCDLTLALARLPEGPQLGLEADSHITADGIAVGTATLYDRKGPYGTGIVTAVSNAAAQIDFTTP